MLESLPVWVQIILQIMYVLFLFSIVFGLLFLGTIAFIICIKTNDLRQDYINSLDEHDKSVIFTYKSIEYPIFRKRKK